jgi:hypothetical protein
MSLTATERDDDLRALDAALAERLFGYVWMRAYRLEYATSPAGIYRGLIPPGRVGEFPEGPALGEERTTADSLNNVPRYSSDITAAFAVIEEMRARTGCGYVIEGHELCCGGDSHVSARFEFPAVRGPWGDGETAPEAIARAALAALESES